MRGKLKPVITVHRANDLIMKVDALLTSSPKGEARKDVKFLKDKHRCSTKSVCILKENKFFHPNAFHQTLLPLL